MTGSPARRATVTATAAVLAALTAGGCTPPDPREKPDPPTSGAATPTSTSAHEGVNTLALTILENIINGDFVAATAEFDDEMKAKLSPEQLASAWTSYQQQLGSYEAHGEPQDVLRDGFTVVNVPLSMAQQPGQFRVTFHDGGTVAGLYFLVAGVPVP